MTAMHAEAQASRASRGPRKSPHSQAKARVKKTKGTRSANQVAKGSHKGKTSKAGLSGLENSKSACTTDISWNDGWSFDEWKDDRSLVGPHEGWEQTCDTSASTFSVEVRMSVVVRSGLNG